MPIHCYLRNRDQRYDNAEEPTHGPQGSIINALKRCLKFWIFHVDTSTGFYTSPAKRS
jgi:hypothetical protein